MFTDSLITLIDQLENNLTHDSNIDKNDQTYDSNQGTSFVIDNQINQILSENSISSSDSESSPSKNNFVKVENPESDDFSQEISKED